MIDITKAQRHLPSAAWAPSVRVFNDLSSTTHADVLSLFDRTIAAVRQEVAHG